MLGKIKVNYDGNTISITLSLISLMLKLPDLCTGESLDLNPILKLFPLAMYILPEAFYTNGKKFIIYP